MNRLYRTYIFLRKSAGAAFKTLFRFLVPLKLKLKTEAPFLVATSNLVATTITLETANLDILAHSYTADTILSDISIPANSIDFSTNAFIPYRCDYITSLIDFGAVIASQVVSNSFPIVTLYINTSLDLTIIDLPTTLYSCWPNTFSTYTYIEHAVDLESVLNTKLANVFLPYIEIDSAIDITSSLTNFDSTLIYTLTYIDSTLDIESTIKQYSPTVFIPEIEIDNAIDLETNINQYIPNRFIPEVIIDSAVDSQAFLQQFEPTKFIPEIEIDSAIEPMISNIDSYSPIFTSSISRIDGKVDVFVTDMYLKPVGGDIFGTYIPVTGKFITEATIDAETYLGDIFSVDNLGAVGSMPFIAGSGTIAATINKFIVDDLGGTGAAPLTATGAISAIKNEFIADTLDIIGRVPFAATNAISTVWNRFIVDDLGISGGFTFNTISLSATSEYAIADIKLVDIDLATSLAASQAVDTFSNISIEAINIILNTDSFTSTQFIDTVGIQGIDIYSIVNPLTSDNIIANISGINELFDVHDIISSTALFVKSDISIIGSLDMYATVETVLAPPIDLGYTTIIADPGINLLPTIYSDIANFINSNTIIDDIYLKQNIVNSSSLQVTPVIFTENINPFIAFNIEDKLVDKTNFSITNKNKFNAIFCYTIFAKLYDYRSSTYALGSMGNITLTELSFHRHNY